MGAHRLTVIPANGKVWMSCDRGDLMRDLGTAPTPDQIVIAANEHWGKPVSGWLS